MKKIIPNSKSESSVNFKKISSLYIALLFTITSFSQFNINFESARSLQKNTFEFQGSFASVSSSYMNEMDHLFNSTGFKIGAGLSDIADIKLSYSRLFGKNTDGINSISLMPKFSTRKQYFAGAIPFGIYFAKDVDLIMYLAPRLIFTYCYKNIFEVSLTPLAHILFGSESINNDLWLGLNLGLGIGSNLDVWSIRPEVGLMKYPGEEGTLWNFGVSLSYNIKLKEQKAQ